MLFIVNMTVGRPRTLLLIACLSTNCLAQMIRGDVHNGTNGEPQSNVAVTLRSGPNILSQGLTDDSGKFSFSLQAGSLGPSASLKVRAVFGGVSYDHDVESAATHVVIYDSAANLYGIHESLAIVQAEAPAKDSLVITELHSLVNDSWPRRTEVGGKGIRLTLPPEVHDVGVNLTEPDGQGARLSFNQIPGQGPVDLPLPLKPGTTKYSIAYQTPYEGKITLRQLARYRIDRAVFVLPQTMQFALDSRGLQFEDLPDDTHAQVHQVLEIPEGQLLTFTISGTGRLLQAFRLADLSKSGVISPTFSSHVQSSNAIGPSGSKKEPATTGSGQHQEQAFVNILAAVLSTLLILLVTWSIVHSRRATFSKPSGSSHG